MSVAPTSEAAVVADVAPTPAALLDRVRAARGVADDAERELLFLAVAWADAHPVLEGDESWRVRWPCWSWLENPGELDAAVRNAADPDVVEWHAIPPVRWDAPASFAAANGLSSAGGQNLIRDALVVRHRLPRLWVRLRAGKVQAWRARKVAQTVLGAPGDVVAYVDAEVAPIAHRCGSVTLDRVLGEALLRLHAEEREVRQLEDLDARYVRLDVDSINHTGIADLHVRGDWADLHDVDTTVGVLAAALARDGSTESLDVRRAVAVGILADPSRAQTLLHPPPDQPGPASAPRKQVVLYVHLTEAGLLGLDPLARCEGTPTATVLDQAVRAWCGRTDTHLSVRPVIDLSTVTAVESYDIPDLMREQVLLTHPTCVFPWCTRPSRGCDLDHVVPWAAGGPTAATNLAPLCRLHHRLKTHTGWVYRPVDPLINPGAYVWTDPHHHRYLRTPTGTTHQTGPPPVG